MDTHRRSARITPGRFSRLIFGLSIGAAAHAAGAQAATRDSSSLADPAGSARWQPALLGTQITVTTQHLDRVHSPYAGVNSLGPSPDTKTSDSYGAYVGAQMTSRLQGYLDVEMIRGAGINRVTGLAGPTNGDVLRQGTVDLGSGPYVARAFVRYAMPLGGAQRDTLGRAMDEMPIVEASHRIEIQAGKFAITDLMDVNRYANATRWQFMNWGLINNTAWDYAADTRGYSNGVVVGWLNPGFTLRLGAMQMPTVANGNHFDPELDRAFGLNGEGTIDVAPTGTVVRFLSYLNRGRMGNYAEALSLARATGSTPNIAADDKPGRAKYGFGLNLEQPLADGGETGLFARAGWSDGANESFVFTEVDREASLGLQLSGAHWSRSADRFGIASVVDGIVAIHQEYLAAGGDGFLLGDGTLTYGREQIVEAYYEYQLGAYVEVSPDFQYIRNPGYNRDRGPATVPGIRVNVRY